jgi:hypothetical protein
MQNLKAQFKKLGLDPSKVSKEEGYFYDWLLELKAQGYIHEIEIQPRYDLTEAIYLPFLRTHKTKTKETTKVVSYSVMQGMHYTPDFNVYWNMCALGKFVFVEDYHIPSNFNDSRLHMFFGHRESLAEGLLTHGRITGHKDVIHTCIEIKGTFASRQNSTAVKFPLLQKLLYDKHKVYVNKCMPLDKKKGIFCKTFTPKSYWLTEKSKKERKLSWTRVSVEQYINLIEELKPEELNEDTFDKRTGSIV